jgi:hypothetical protein
MKLVRLGWILIAIVLLNASAGMFWTAAPERHTTGKTGPATSGGAKRHLPAELQLDRGTASLPRPETSSMIAQAADGSKKECIELDPHFPGGYALLTFVHAAKGDLTEATRWAEHPLFVRTPLSQVPAGLSTPWQAAGRTHSRC